MRRDFIFYELFDAIYMMESKTVRWWQGLLQILVRPWRTVLWAAAIVVLVTASMRFAPEGKLLDYLGGMLQIVGLILVLEQLRRTAKEFSTHPFNGAKLWLKDIWYHFRPRSYSIIAGTGHFTLDGADTLSATGTHYDRTDPQSRMDYIERVIEAHKAEEVAQRAEIWKGLEGLQVEMHKLVADQSARAEEIEAKVRTQSIGNLDASIIGVTLTLIGTALSSL